MNILAKHFRFFYPNLDDEYIDLFLFVDLFLWEAIWYLCDEMVFSSKENNERGTEREGTEREGRDGLVGVKDKYIQRKRE